eukprot:11959936-Alexandrium_andersonii.AAC.1
MPECSDISDVYLSGVRRTLNFVVLESRERGTPMSGSSKFEKTALVPQAAFSAQRSAHNGRLMPFSA